MVYMHLDPKPYLHEDHGVEASRHLIMRSPWTYPKGSKDLLEVRAGPSVQVAHNSALIACMLSLRQLSQD